MGIESFYNNHFASRVKYLITDPNLRPKTHLYLQVFGSEVDRFTLLQIFILSIITIITIFGGLFSISFPLFIIAMIPLYRRIFPSNILQ
jgi:hypothetical protein